MQALYITLGVIGGLAVLYFAIYIVGFFFLISKFIKRQPYSELGESDNQSEQRKSVTNPRRRAAADILRPMQYELLEITSFDNLLLKGRLFRAKPDNKRLIMCFHGHTSNGIREFGEITLDFLKNGYDVFLVSQRAHHESQGKYTGMGVLERHDVVKWAKHMSDEVYASKDGSDSDVEIVLYGISMGAASVAMAAGLRLPHQVKGAIFDCGFTSMASLITALVKSKAPPVLSTKLLVSICSAGNKLLFGKYRFDEVDASEEIKKAKIPFLFFHGENDPLVPHWMSKQVYDNCPTDKEYVLVGGAEHVAALYIETERYLREVYALFEKCFSNQTA